VERMTCSLSSIQAGSWPELPCDWAGRDCCLQDASLIGFCFCTAGASRGDEAGCLGGKNEKKLQREDSLTKRESLWTPVLGGDKSPSQRTGVWSLAGSLERWDFQGIVWSQVCWLESCWGSGDWDGGCFAVVLIE
jgi:hypothetical protein